MLNTFNPLSYLMGMIIVAALQGCYKNQINTYKLLRSSHRDAAEMNPTRNHEVVGSIPGLAQWVTDLALLWLWRRLAATTLIRPLAWEPPFSMGVAPKRQKRPKKNPKKQKQKQNKNKNPHVNCLEQWVTHSKC